MIPLLTPSFFGSFDSGAQLIRQKAAKADEMDKIIFFIWNDFGYFMNKRKNYLRSFFRITSAVSMQARPISSKRSGGKRKAGAIVVTAAIG